MGFVKMIVVDDLSEVIINYEAEKALKPSVNAISDDWRGYRGLTKVIVGLKHRVTPPKKAMEYLPWVHTVISNAKKITSGVHHSVSNIYTHYQPLFASIILMILVSMAGSWILF
ncbi:MAG: transposase [Saprospiraceae bacterium]|nr:transposase [Candidatus Defluviibacterium haderslevense]MBK7243801.1 transposase [Candidatus Defluviibacterium haderslevense]